MAVVNNHATDMFTMSGTTNLISGILWIARFIPRSCGLALARALGTTFYRLMPERRLVAMTNLDIAFSSSLTRKQKNRIAKQSFQNFFCLFFDFLKLSQLSTIEQARFIEIQGEEHLKQALSMGKGVLAISAHFGNFLLLLSALSQKGYPIHVVTRHFKNKRADDIYTGILALFGTKTFSKDRVAPLILRALKDGAIVGYVLDQNMQRENGIFVDSFGRPACTIKGLATLAGRYGSPILSAYMVSEADGRHCIHIEPPYLPEHGRGSKDRESEIAQMFTKRIEAWIRRYPDQWMWTHRRWKTRPSGEPDIYPPRRGIKRQLKAWRRRLSR